MSPGGDGLLPLRSYPLHGGVVGKDDGRVTPHRIVSGVELAVSGALHKPRVPAGVYARPGPVRYVPVVQETAEAPALQPQGP